MTVTAKPEQMMLKNILYCTDFSEAADHALPYAADLARHFGAKLWAMHVRLDDWDRVEVSAMEPYSIEEAEGKIRGLLAPLRDVSYEVLVPTGQIWPSVEKAIQEDQIDLLVIGTRGRTGISKFFLGSSAEEIFRHASCAVLTVGPHAPGAPSAKKQISEVLYATDFGPNSERAAAYAISLAREYHANLTLIYALPDPEASGPLMVITEELKRSLANRLLELIPPGIDLSCKPRTLVLEEKVAEAILKAAGEPKADLIVLGVHPEHGVPGAATHLPFATVHKVLTQATCPVLTVRT